MWDGGWRQPETVVVPDAFWRSKFIIGLSVFIYINKCLVTEHAPETKCYRQPESKPCLQSNKNFMKKRFIIDGMEMKTFMIHPMKNFNMLNHLKATDIDNTVIFFGAD